MFPLLLISYIVDCKDIFRVISSRIPKPYKPSFNIKDMFKSLKEKLGGWFKKVAGKDETSSKDETLEKQELKLEPQEVQAEKSVADQAQPATESTESQQPSNNKEKKKGKKEKDLKKDEKSLEQPISKPLPKPEQKTEIIEDKKHRKLAELEPLDSIPEPQISEQRKEVIEKLAPAQDHNQSTINISTEKQEHPRDNQEQSEYQKKSKGFFSSIKERFLTKKVTEEEFNALFDELEMIMIENNVALEAIDQLRKSLHEKIVNQDIKKVEVEEHIKTVLRESIEKLLITPFDLIPRIKQKKNEPFVILLFGINGSGKTTTVAKLTHLLKAQKISCVLAAADTFRAASIEQLSIHGDALGVKVIKHDYGSDPAAVAFDAIKYAKQHHIQAVLVDTAGRMHTKENLMSEMQKIARIAKPDMKLFIGESITGNDAVEQARNFNEAIGIDGIVLSKTDIDEKGGTALSMGYVTGKPILYLGTGQKYSDLEPFQKEKLLASLGL